jgi:phospholipase A2
MLGTAGYCVGFEALGLFDAVTYMVGLSGSTWAINYWMTTGGSAQAMRERLFKKAQRGIQKTSQVELRKLVDALLVKWAFEEEITLVDLYGGLLANVLFDEAGNGRQRVHLSDQAKRIQDGSFAFPIYTAVSGKEKNRKWYEYTPYEIGGAWIGCYVPTWAYGRHFSSGMSQDFAPEQSLGYLCGTFGSAFAVTFERLYKEMAGASLDNVLDGVARDLAKVYVPDIAISLMRSIVERLFATRISSARVFNFTQNMPGSPVKRIEKLSFVDAGLAFNLPYPPISGERADRRPDVIIFLDLSASVQGAPALRKAEAYARSHDVPFPAIVYEGIEKHAISVFKDEHNPEAPLVIYAPCAKDDALIKIHFGKKPLHELVRRIENFDVPLCIEKSFCNTFNFVYKEHEARQLSTLTEFNICASEEKIRKALMWKMAQKKGKE